MSIMAELHALGVTDLHSYDLGKKTERDRIIKRIKNQICFTATKTGYCEYHGGKCTELLELIRNLKGEK